MPFRQAPVELFSPLTPAEILELNTAINPPFPPPYIPLHVQVALDNIGQGGTVTARKEIMVMTDWGGPGYVGALGAPIPPGQWWVPTAFAANKYLRLLCERTSGLFMAVQGEMLHSLFRVTHRMLHSHETARSRVLAAQASHVFMQVVDDRFGQGLRHHTLIVISPKRKTIDSLDDYNGLQSTRPDLVPPLPRHYVAEQKFIGHILNLLSFYMGGTNISGSEFNPMHWMMRTNASAQNPIPGPAAAIGQHISASMVCHNALMIPMGCCLDFFGHIPAGMTQAQMIANRRGQIALGLHRGQLAVAPSRQYIAPMWPEQSDNFP
ncbi:hypothetical protein BcDW1_4377 [Botrytis cinerea BcDW1]|uniref:Uncharacterized protein n=1 Tax=Botryotinia fuckeliana (strain BcDW1) TaxID=1290391 RepID=M7TTN8_BOTF1|nr:hypothetical protein BcDW1_4377 [Botrytis cinerea BcDW1]